MLPRLNRRATSVLVVTTALVRGGAEQQAVVIAVELAKRGWDVRLLTLRKPRAYLSDLSSAGVETLSLEMIPGRPNLAGVMRAVQLIHSLRPDIVHAHLFHANLLVRLLRLVCAIPVLICTSHSEREESLYREWAYRLSDRLCDITSHVTQNAHDEYVAKRVFRPEKSIVISNGIDTERFARNETVRDQVRIELSVQTSFVWLCQARLEPVKNHQILLLAFADLAAKYPNTLLLLAGTGTMREKLNHQATELNLGQKVRFLGEREDIPRLVNAADGIVISSNAESFGIAIVEALSAGKAVVSTACAGPREILGDEWGQLVPIGDARALSIAMENVMTGKWRCPNYDAVRAYVTRQYSTKAMVSKWELVYETRLGMISD